MQFEIGSLISSLEAVTLHYVCDNLIAKSFNPQMNIQDDLNIFAMEKKAVFAIGVHHSFRLVPKESYYK